MDLNASFARWLSRYDPIKPETIINGSSLATVLIDDRDDDVLRRVFANFQATLGSDWDHIVLNIRGGSVPLLDDGLWLDLKKYDRVMIYQRDTVSFKALDKEFLKYDYIGAPCSYTTMNGGLSLRNPWWMRYALRFTEPLVDEPEDVYFTRVLRDSGANLPRTAIAATFSVESLYAEVPFGVHGTDKGYINDDLAEYIVSRAECLA